MTRGNQRDTDRAKAAKKQAALNKSKAKESNTSLAKRKEARDAEILRAKQKKRDEEKAAEAAGNAAKSIK